MTVIFVPRFILEIKRKEKRLFGKEVLLEEKHCKKLSLVFLQFLIVFRENNNISDEFMGFRLDNKNGH